MGQGKTVLIVEDHPDLRELLAETLRLEGWATIIAAGVEDAIRVARAATQTTTPIHVVLTDVLLPPTSGAALERTFKADPVLAHIPFVFMSGFEPHLHEVGRERSLLKPFETTELCALLAAFAHRGPPAASN